MPLKDKTIAVIGSGNMGEALIRGLLDSGAVTLRQLIATDVHPGRLEQIGRTFGIYTTEDNAAAVSKADVVLLAVKPQQMSQALASLNGEMTTEKLVISIAAGVTTGRIERELGGEFRVVRVMPNTPAQIGAGAAALCRGRHATEKDLATAEAILRRVGMVVRTEESQLDAVTALSGTGPAYVFLVGEAMIRAGRELGLSKDLARKLTLQTIIGAARLMMESGEEPETLRRKVTSPGGTTEAAMRVMSEGKLVEIFLQAVKAAAQRSRELSG